MSGPISSVEPQTLAKSRRLRKRREFLRVQNHGTRSFGRFVVIVCARPPQKSLGRIGITVPKKVGAAHLRNKIKRRIRHIFRLNQNLFYERNLVIIARASSGIAAFSALHEDIISACARLRHDNKKPALRKHS